MMKAPVQTEPTRRHFFTRDRNQRKSSGERCVLLVIPPVRELDLVGIVDVFATANGFLPPERQYQVGLVTSSAQSNIEECADFSSPAPLFEVGRRDRHVACPGRAS